MKIPQPVVLSNKFIERLKETDVYDKLKLEPGSHMSSFKYEIMGPSKGQGIYIFINPERCTIEYRNFEEGGMDNWILTEENLEDVVQEVYVILIGAE